MHVTGFGCLAVTLAMGATAALPAQTVRGHVIDQATNRPVGGVVILAIDSGGTIVSRGMSDAAGRYSVAVGRPGSFTLRSMRLGFRPSTSPAFRLARADDVVRDIAVTGIPARLEAVVTTATTQCQQIRSDTIAPAYQVLDQIRTTLHATELTTRSTVSRVLNVRMTEIDRLLNPANRTVIRQEARIRHGLTSSPWSSRSAEMVHDSGYSRLDPSGMVVYFAPDIGVLVSPEFVEDHCFRVARAVVGEDIRLEFEPVPSRRRLPEIRGAMFVDPRTTELRQVDFEYVNVPRHISEAGSGGTLRFVRARTDAWLISGWSLRLPVYESREVPVSGGIARMRRTENRLVMTAIREIGAELGLVLRASDTVFAARGLPLRGRVLDSASGEGIQAHLRLRGTGISMQSGPAGSYAVTGVLPGLYILEIRTRDRDPWGLQTRSVTVTPLDTAHVITLPSPVALMRDACGDTVHSAVVGRVAWKDSTPVSEATVSVSWKQGEAHVMRDTLVDLHGYFRVCGVPFDVPAIVQVTRPGVARSEHAVQLRHGEPIALLDVVVDSARTASGVLQGTIRDATSGRTIGNAAVRLTRHARTTVTDTEGRYRFAQVDSGSDTLSIRRLGFRGADIPVRLGEREALERNAVLERLVVLDTVSVRESRLPASFHDNQRLGLGQFLTRAELEPQQHRRLSEVLQSRLRGINLVRSMGSQAGLMSNRGRKTISDRNLKCFELEGTTLVKCGCFPAVYLDGIAIFDGRSGSFFPDINRFTLSSIEAIEFYGGPAETPAIYNNLDSACGVLVLHSRR